MNVLKCNFNLWCISFCYQKKYFKILKRSEQKFGAYTSTLHMRTQSFAKNWQCLWCVLSNVPENYYCFSDKDIIERYVLANAIFSLVVSCIKKIRKYPRKENFFSTKNYLFYAWHKKYWFFVKQLYEHINIKMNVWHFCQIFSTFWNTFKSN
jgi:hypothetical protein